MRPSVLNDDLEQSVFSKIRQYFHKYDCWYKFLSFAIYSFQWIMEVIWYLVVALRKILESRIMKNFTSVSVCTLKMLLAGFYKIRIVIWGFYQYVYLLPAHLNLHEPKQSSFCCCQFSSLNSSFHFYLSRISLGSPMAIISKGLQNFYVEFIK